MSGPSDNAGKGGAPELPTIDITERAGHHTGNPQSLESRLFMQLLVFDCQEGTEPDAAAQGLADGLKRAGAGGVVYQDANAPRGLALLSWAEDPAVFVGPVRDTVLAQGAGLKQRDGWTMLGRTYSTGYEPDLRHWLLDRPVKTVLNEAWPWAVWYPLRRSGAFEQLEGRDKGAILREHATIGRAYGAQDLAHDVRLACHGLDAKDSEFVIGLIGKELYPLSHVVQRMRGTQQTSQYIAQMGPFFVGRAVHRVG